ncbi:hypothetical protein AB7351_21090, partial [Providencia rettgeri]
MSILYKASRLSKVLQCVKQDKHGYYSIVTVFSLLISCESLGATMAVSPGDTVNISPTTMAAYTNPVSWWINTTTGITTDAIVSVSTSPSAGQGLQSCASLASMTPTYNYAGLYGPGIEVKGSLSTSPSAVLTLNGTLA